MFCMTSRTPKRPRDANQLAKAIADIATGEATDEVVDAKKSKAGKRGAKVRARSLTAEQRSDIARAAAEARWKKS